MDAETEKLIADFATKVGDKMAGISKEITDQIYGEMLDSLQSYLADNVVFNIGAMFDAQAATIRRLTAERDEARAECERAKAVVNMADNIIAEQMGLDVPEAWVAAVLSLAAKEPK